MNNPQPHLQKNHTNVVLSAQRLSKTFDDGRNQVEVLKGLDFSIHEGEFVSIVGTSGSGKSTLLHILGGLDLPTSGEIILKGHAMNRLNETKRGNLRNQYLGFVYQFHHLLPEFDAIENVSMPLMLRENSTVEQAQQRATELLTKVGLKHRLTHKPGELSGGERQRVALARALVTSPAVVLADEPTGNLDRRTALDIMDLLKDLRSELNMAMLIVTHDDQLAHSGDRILHMQDGLWVNSSN
ncbi:lipoprotein releasing system, ATP-binding protein [Alkanindiges hydrocarboniclasticus]|jgi:lipoprotein-releasing system ATP-binding protein|uniref:Lipoprotein-releasing system ATP-binding protein LolD n=1 Tax=Alkanindiges hydrocarboniclasticus TaxID=1907941 RepID=A0A1S8CYS4_9GAMM|nr:lipoprotein-releasing ABC transporter ATP-binding protein LolD [Alkanindiges hydrocarboniclasticus]ONG41620.1 lipoprotein releasing system, ATP-binding protein [Alkanindiges hydrocarboniclasticus]